MQKQIQRRQEVERARRLHNEVERTRITENLKKLETDIERLKRKDNKRSKSQRKLKGGNAVGAGAHSQKGRAAGDQLEKKRSKSPEKVLKDIMM